MKKWHLIPLILIVVVIFFIGLKVGQKAAPVCPDDFATFDQSVAAFDLWTKNYFDSHPHSTLADLNLARRDFYVQNGCKAALERYDSHNQ